jgi:hypothetical protein
VANLILCQFLWGNQVLHFGISQHVECISRASRGCCAPAIWLAPGSQPARENSVQQLIAAWAMN